MGSSVAVRSIGRDHIGHLRVDVERVVVARNRQRAVALRIPVAQALGIVRLTVHTDPLHGRGHVGVAVLEHLGRVATAEVLVAGGDVVPEHDHRPVEGRGVDRTHDHQAGLVRCALRRLDLPATVPRELGPRLRSRSGRPPPPGSTRRRDSPTADRSVVGAPNGHPLPPVIGPLTVLMWFPLEWISSVGPELTLEHLAGGVARQRLDERDLFGDLEAGQLGLAVCDERVRP